MPRSWTWNAEWDGSTDTDFGTGTNWDDNSAPIAGDHLLISVSSRDIAGSDESAVDLATVWFDRLCARPAGSTGSPLILACNNVVLQGTGKKVIKAGGAGIDYCTVDMNNRNEVVEIHPAATDIFGNLKLIQCKANLAAVAGLIDFGNVGPNADLETENGAGGFTTLVNRGLRTLSKSLVTNLYNLPGGIFTQEDGAGATVTNAHCAPDSVFNYDYEGTLAYLTADEGAVVDLNRTGYAKTITTAVLHPRSIVRAGPHVTITNLFYGEA